MLILAYAELHPERVVITTLDGHTLARIQLPSSLSGADYSLYVE